MIKTEIYTWRLSPVTKAALEEAARQQNRSIADLLEEIVTDKLGSVGAGADTESEQQRRLHARAARFAGHLSGPDPQRAERAGELVRDRLKKRRASAD